MNTGFLLRLFVVLCVSICSVQADEKSVDSLVNQFYGPFGLNSDGEARFDGLCGTFLHQVPEADQAEVLAGMLDRAMATDRIDRSVIADVCLFLENSGKQIVWNHHLQNTVWSFSKTSDQYIRYDIIALLATKNDDKSRQIVIASLNDPFDSIRYKTREAINGWQDAISIYQKYIEAHYSDANFADSIVAVTYELHGLQGIRSVDDYASHFYGSFTADLDDGAVFMFANFNHEVPAAVQMNVLDRMFDHAMSAKPRAYRAIGEILSYRQGVHPEFILSEGFESNLRALTVDFNYLARRDAIQFLGSLKRDKDIEVFTATLNDPKDEVRAAAISALQGRPAAKDILRLYIQNYQDEPGHGTSVAYARAALASITEVRTEAK